jgi:hypothetical protein
MFTTMPMQIQPSSSSNSIAFKSQATASNSSINSLNSGYHQRQMDTCTPTFIEVGAGSYQEGMPVMRSGPGSGGSHKSSMHHQHAHHHGSSASSNAGDVAGENLIESIADAMNELATTTSPAVSSSSGKSGSLKARHNSNQFIQSKTASPAISIQPSTSNVRIRFLFLNLWKKRTKVREKEHERVFFFVFPYLT